MKDDFSDNVHFQQSCAFSLFQIGEIVKRLSDDLTSGHVAIRWKEIAEFRDIVAHYYGKVDLSIVWRAASS